MTKGFFVFIFQKIVHRSKNCLLRLSERYICLRCIVRVAYELELIALCQRFVQRRNDILVYQVLDEEQYRQQTTLARVRDLELA